MQEDFGSNAGRGRRAGRTIALRLATGFGLGYSPVASGTVGTLLGLPLVLMTVPAMTRPGGWLFQALVAAALAVLAVPICQVAERHFGIKDDGRIVADEYLTFPICMIGLPWSWPVLGLAFLTCRACDILKPWPADRLQALRGGAGIVADDVVASLYSLCLNHAIVRIWMYAGGFGP